MSTRRIVAAIVLAMPVALAGLGVGLAQGTGPAAWQIPSQVIEVGFPFEAGSKTAPAGKYELSQPEPDVLRLRSSSGLDYDMPVVTRLARPVTPLKEGRVVFDRVAETRWVSEVWVPNADGFVIGITKQPHTHEAVMATPKK